MTGPTTGRIVHYKSRGSADGMFPPLCRAAVVTDGDGIEETCGLAILNPTGLFFDLSIDHDEDQEPGTWHWPCVHTDTPSPGGRPDWVEGVEEDAKRR